MAFYFALFNVSAINLEEHGKRQHYKELKKSRNDSGERRRQRCRSADGRQKGTRRRSVGEVHPKADAITRPDDNASTSGAAVARHDETLSNITPINGSLDSIPFVLNDYRKLPKPKILRSGKMDSQQKSKKGSSRPTAHSKNKSPIMANGDVLRISIGGINDTDNDTFSIPATPPALAVSPPPIIDDRDFIRDRRNTQIAITRRGSTASYKRVTFQYEQALATTDHDESRRGTERSAAKSSSGFFSKPVGFLGGLSLDDRHRHSQKRNSVPDRPPDTNEVLLNLNYDKDTTRRPSSALGKLRAVIKKLIIENRRQRLLASHWPQGQNEGNWGPAPKLQENQTQTPTTSSPSETGVHARINSQDGGILPATPTPTPTEPPQTPATEQLQINFQNMTNSMLEMQQKETMGYQQWSSPGDAQSNRYGRSLSMQMSHYYQPSLPSTKIQAIASPTRQRQRYTPTGLTNTYSNTNSDQYLRRRHQLQTRNSGNDHQIFVRLLTQDGADERSSKATDTIGRRPGNSVDHRHHRRSQSPPHHSCHQDFRKRWSAIVEGAITRHGSMTGSYHPRLVEQQAASHQLLTASCESKQKQHRRVEEEQNRSTKHTDWSHQTLQKTRMFQPSRENSRERKLSNVNNPSSQAETLHQEARKLKSDLDRRKEVADEQNDKIQKRQASVVRRRSTTDKKPDLEKSRSLFGWFSGNDDSASHKRTDRTSASSSRKRDSDSDEATDLQALLSCVQYDENRNLSYNGNESGDEFKSTPLVQRRHFRKKQARSLILGAKDDPASQPTTATKWWRHRFPINCYINPLFTSHSAPSSPARKGQSLSLRRQQHYQESGPLCAIAESVDSMSKLSGDIRNNNQEGTRKREVPPTK